MVSITQEPSARRSAVLTLNRATTPRASSLRLKAEPTLGNRSLAFCRQQDPPSHCSRFCVETHLSHGNDSTPSRFQSAIWPRVSAENLRSASLVPWEAPSSIVKPLHGARHCLNWLMQSAIGRLHSHQSPAPRLLSASSPPTRRALSGSPKVVRSMQARPRVRRPQPRATKILGPTPVDSLSWPTMSQVWGPPLIVGTSLS